jgi:hypothetical protein
MVERSEGAFIVACASTKVTGDVEAPPVRWWSFTKSCFAAAALVLVERGKLNLDAPLPGPDPACRITGQSHCLI